MKVVSRYTFMTIAAVTLKLREERCKGLKWAHCILRKKKQTLTSSGQTPAEGSTPTGQELASIAPPAKAFSPAKPNTH
ncbi:hypothetical protein AVEN_74706-1 [Araneus ventricosus]|uniref:Uncharacterized protein n=1 Tax=Araneus ventricosus TaxID=182803 RepID=A0A4Y2GD57_ARAVE|nr:hypothetical protein AVEN_74706-1 [Araneus ventricosus]